MTKTKRLLESRKAKAESTGKGLPSSASVWVLEQLKTHVGRKAAVIVLLLIGAFSFVPEVVKNSDVLKVAIHRILNSIAPTPKAEIGKFNIAVAQLAGDNDKNEFHELLVDSLKEFPGVVVLSLPREQAPGGTPEAHASAKTHLSELNAQAMIWGKVQRLEGKARYYLNWTTSANLGFVNMHAASGGLNGASGLSQRAYMPAADISLPSMFFDDLKQVLLLVVAQRAPELLIAGSPDKVAQLRLHVKKVEALLVDSGLRFDEAQLAEIRFHLAFAESQVGWFGKDEIAMSQAISLYKQVLTQHNLENSPQMWAMAQNNLGTILSSYVEFLVGSTPGTGSRIRLTDAVRILHDAVAAHREALKIYTRDGAPNEWAMTQTSLGTVFDQLGRMESGTKYLTEAVFAHREALKVYTRQSDRFLWASVQFNLGQALMALGQRETDSAHLIESIDAYREALKEITRKDSTPIWIVINNNTRIALRILGERENGTRYLSEALVAYRQTLQETSREQAPLEWAILQRDMGNILVILGRREPGTESLEMAVDAYREFFKVETRARSPFVWGWTQHSLGTVFELLAERYGDRVKRMEQLQLASLAFLESLATYQELKSTKNIDAAQSSLARIRKLQLTL